MERQHPRVYIQVAHISYIKKMTSGNQKEQYWTVDQSKKEKIAAHWIERTCMARRNPHLLQLLSEAKPS
jgi:hypothetical protein